MSVLIQRRVTGFSYRIDEDKMSGFILEGRLVTMSDLLSCIYITVENDRIETTFRCILKRGTHYDVQGRVITFRDQNLETAILVDQEVEVIADFSDNRILIISTDDRLNSTSFPGIMICKLLENWFDLSGQIELINEYVGSSRKLKYRFKHILKPPR